jgi:hypothetical protein
MKPKRNTPETDLQITVLEYMFYQYRNAWDNAFHPKTEGYYRYDKRFMGNTPGCLDLYIMVPNREFHGMIIELKAPKKKMTAEQIAWEARHISNGYYVCCCDSLDKVIDHLNIYFGGKI